MQPRAEEIHRVLEAFVQAKRSGDAERRRRAFGLLVQGSTPMLAEVRELRAACAMIDIGSSIYTLAFADILGIDPVPGEGGLRVTVRPGCFASHVAARLRRAAPRSWSTAPTAGRQLARQSDPYESYVREAAANESPAAKSKGGTADGDPASSESAGHELVVNDAERTRR